MSATPLTPGIAHARPHLRRSSWIRLIPLTIVVYLGYAGWVSRSPLHTVDLIDMLTARALDPLLIWDVAEIGADGPEWDLGQ